MLDSSVLTLRRKSGRINRRGIRLFWVGTVQPETSRRPCAVCALNGQLEQIPVDKPTYQD